MGAATTRIYSQKPQHLQSLPVTKRMPGDKKLETAEELLELYNDLEKLKGYKYSQPVVSQCGINNEEFHTDLPYQDIKKIVEDCHDRFLAAVPEPERPGLRWEHVGSTVYTGNARHQDARCPADCARLSSQQGSYPGLPGLWLLFQLLLKS
eukprot:TRINITY_DN17518_c0_g1_i1.p1 TRINITY_DN17518_c0_g1~~TRINITY_DN17518_c0_g1_i1.p1  ORF type:complete len:159 (-),score=58.53 TRINITY_DN17518_c0_g1_i1:144-596(-)